MAIMHRLSRLLLGAAGTLANIAWLWNLAPPPL
jgi:hypothetical protein